MINSRKNRIKNRIKNKDNDQTAIWTSIFLCLAVFTINPMSFFSYKNVIKNTVSILKNDSSGYESNIDKKFLDVTSSVKLKGVNILTKEDNKNIKICQNFAAYRTINNVKDNENRIQYKSCLKARIISEKININKMNYIEIPGGNISVIKNILKIIMKEDEMHYNFNGEDAKV